MRDSAYRISLDIHEVQSQVSLPIKLGDTARRIYITLTEGGKPFEVGNDCVAIFSALKSDGNRIFNDCIIEDNRIRYDITAQTVSAEGIVNAELILYGSDEAVLASPRFDLVVDDRVAGVETISEEEKNFFDSFILSEQERVANEQNRIKEFNNLGLNVEDNGDYYKLIKTNKDGSRKEFLIAKGKNGENGKDYVITSADYKAIADKIVTDTLDSQAAEYFENLENQVEESVANFETEISEDVVALEDGVSLLSQELAVERARITNLASLEDGSTTGDAELIDIRVGVDGKVYSSAGESVRTQIGQLSNEVGGIEEIIGTPVLLWEQGGIDSSSGVNTRPDYANHNFFVRTSNYIKVGRGVNIVFPITDRAVVFKYDVNKNFIEQVGYANSVTISSDDAFYIRLRMFHSNSSAITPEYANENVSVAYKDSTALVGRKVCTYGDSITKNGTWQSIIKAELNLGDIYNLGWSDSAVTLENKTLYINADGTYNSNPIGSTVQPSGTTEVQCSFCHDDRIAYIPTDTEIVLVMGGTNDLYRNRPIGNITNDGVYDENTFVGALISTVKKIQTRVPNATIILMTPITKPSTQDSITTFVNNNGNTVVDYVNAVRNVADYVGCNLIDVHNCGITLFNASSKLSDGTHPNSDGHKLIAKTVLSGLKQIFSVV